MPELDNPIFPAFAQVIETALAQHGYTPVLCTQTPGGVHEDDYVQMLLDRGVSGIIFVSGLHADTTTDPERYRALRERGLPIVLVNGYLEGIDAPFISNDDVASMDLAVSHLVSLGHTQIGLALGPRPLRAGHPQDRRASARRCTRRLGATTSSELIERTLFSVEGGDGGGARGSIERGCTAIVCGSDLMALGAIRAARALGLAVPGGRARSSGYDDSPLIAFTDPPLTTVRQASRRWRRRRCGPCSTRSPASRRRAPEYVFRPDQAIEHLREQGRITTDFG